MLGVNSNSLEQKSRIQSALITVLVQGLLFLAFYFIIVWEQSNPPKPTYGMELNLGFSDLGSGDQSQVLTNTSENPSTEAPAPGEMIPTQQVAVPTTTPKTASTKPSTNQAVSTQPSPIKGETTANAPPAKEEQKEATPKIVEQPKVDQRAIFGAGGKSGKSSPSSTSTGQGNSDSKGDQGSPSGTGKGAAGGAGYSLDLAGWDFASRPAINDQVSTRNGRIVFKITVDGSGKVVQAIPLEYNVSNAVLAYYRQVVNQLDFKKSGATAADFSTGKITFVVKVE